MLENIEPKSVLRFFEEISKIPRGSGKEKTVSDYIRNWAEGLELEVQQDEDYNLIVKKPATPGRESREPVIIQSHMDMVCEKTGDSNHDFERDPILLKIEGDEISSAVGTTLGADNGIGMALSMALLEDDTVKNPPLEVLFTVREEVDFGGAKVIAVEGLKGKKLINLDHAVDNEVLAGGCGGEGEEVTVDMTETVVSGYEGMRVMLTGLPGGHSGEDIHRGYGDAVYLLTRALRGCKEIADLRLCSFAGGTGSTAIPREAEAVVLFRVSEKEVLLGKIEEIGAEMTVEYQGVAPDFSLVAEEVEVTDGCCYDEESFEKFLAVMELFPRGIMEMSGVFPGVVESSINVGIVKTQGDKCTFYAELRGSLDSTIQQVKQKVITLTKVFGGRLKSFDDYTSWSYNPDSKLRETAIRIYRELFDEELKTTVVHAGIEAGIFTKRIEGLDAISLGPDCRFFHSPEERVSVSSVAKVWKFLKALVEEL